MDKQMQTDLRKMTKSLAMNLKKRGRRIVLAESCTGGLLASLFTEIPGASQIFCGSQVVYREDSKRRWAGVRTTTLARRTAVSAEVTEELARGVLRKTPEATYAAAITGYLGPSGKRIGTLYVSVTKRGRRSPSTQEFLIELRPGVRRTPTRARIERRYFAALALLACVESFLDDDGPLLKRSGKRESA